MENLTPACAVEAPAAANPITANAKMIFLILTFRFRPFGHIFPTPPFDFYSMRGYQYSKQGRAALPRRPVIRHAQVAGRNNPRLD
jgi:hypothetical protein